MSQVPPRTRRRQERFLIDLPLCLWDASHRLIDSQALAHDVTPAGFGFETKHDLRHVGLVYFELRLPGGESASGAAQVMWCRRGDWGSWAGANIGQLSWRDRRKIMKVIHRPGYDWSGLANRAVIGGLAVILAVAAQKILSRNSDSWMGFPWLALAACAAAVAYFNARD